MKITGQLLSTFFLNSIYNLQAVLNSIEFARWIDKNGQNGSNWVKSDQNRSSFENSFLEFKMKFASCSIRQLGRIGLHFWLLIDRQKILGAFVLCLGILCVQLFLRGL